MTMHFGLNIVLILIKAYILIKLYPYILLYKYHKLIYILNSYNYNFI